MRPETQPAATPDRRRSRVGPLTWASANPVLALLAAALAVSATVLIVIGWKLSFFLDDWTFLLYRRGSLDQAILDPHGENVVIGLSIAYKALANVFGIESAVPFRVVLTALFLTGSVLVFIYLRRRVGDYLALVGTAMTLLMGAAYEDLLWPIQIGYFISFVCGLGALLFLHRHDRRGDIAACVLLTVAVTSFSLGVPFVAGAAIAIALGRDRWRRAYVVAIPVAVYALWWLGWGYQAETEISSINIATSPIFLLDGFASSLSSLLGLATPGTQEAIGPLAWGRPLLAVAMLVGAYRLHRLGRIPEWLWVIAATAAAFWLLAGFNEKAGREPTVSRYQHIGAVFILLIAAELVAGLRLRRPAMIVITVIAGAAIVSNMSYLWQARNSYLLTSELERAGLAAIEIARDTVDPGFRLDPKFVDTAYVYVSASVYLPAVDDYGSPAYTPEELVAVPEHARVAADKTLAGALRLTFTRGRGSGVSPGPAPAAVGETAVISDGACVMVDGAAEAPAIISLPPGGAQIEARGEGQTAVRLRRYAGGSFPVNGGTLEGGGSAELAIPLDRATEPWEAEFTGSQRVRVCGRPTA